MWQPEGVWIVVNNLSALWSAKFPSMELDTDFRSPSFFFKKRIPSSFHNQWWKLPGSDTDKHPKVVPQGNFAILWQLTESCYSMCCGLNCLWNCDQLVSAEAANGANYGRLWGLLGFESMFLIHAISHKSLISWAVCLNQPGLTCVCLLSSSLFLFVKHSMILLLCIIIAVRQSWMSASYS